LQKRNSKVVGYSNISYANSIVGNEHNIHVYDMEMVCYYQEMVITSRLTRPFSGRVPRPPFTITLVQVPPLCPRPLTASVRLSKGFVMVQRFFVLLVLMMACTNATSAFKAIAEVNENDKVILREIMAHYSDQDNSGEFLPYSFIYNITPCLPALLLVTDEESRNYDCLNEEVLFKVSVSIAENPKCLEYIYGNFDSIAHSRVKQWWAALSYKSGNPTYEVMKYLKSTVNIDDCESLMYHLVFWDWEIFQNSVRLFSE